MLQQIDDKWTQGEHLLFEDQGKVSPTSKTKKFQVISRHSKAVIGYVFWYAPWRQYVLMALNSILDKKCMRETSDFCEKATEDHRAAAKAKRKRKR